MRSREQPEIEVSERPGLDRGGLELGHFQPGAAICEPATKNYQSFGGQIQIKMLL